MNYSWLPREDIAMKHEWKRTDTGIARSLECSCGFIAGAGTHGKMPTNRRPDIQLL